MKLTELKEAVERAIEYARECGEDPDSIPVTLQIDRSIGDPIWAENDVELLPGDLGIRLEKLSTKEGDG